MNLHLWTYRTHHNGNAHVILYVHVYYVPSL